MVLDRAHSFGDLGGEPFETVIELAGLDETVAHQFRAQLPGTARREGSD